MFKFSPWKNGKGSGGSTSVSQSDRLSVKSSMPCEAWRLHILGLISDKNPNLAGYGQSSDAHSNTAGKFSACSVAWGSTAILLLTIILSCWIILCSTVLHREGKTQQAKNVHNVASKWQVQSKSNEKRTLQGGRSHW